MSKNGNEDQPTIDLSSDEETPNVGEEEEDDGVELVTIRPMAKSQLIDHDARPPPSPETKEQIAEVSFTASKVNRLLKVSISRSYNNDVQSMFDDDRRHNPQHSGRRLIELIEPPGDRFFWF